MPSSLPDITLAFGLRGKRRKAFLKGLKEEHGIIVAKPQRKPGKAFAMRREEALCPSQGRKNPPTPATTQK